MIFGLLKGASTAKSLLGGKKVDNKKMLPGGYQKPNYKPGEGGTDFGERHRLAMGGGAIVVRPASAIVPVKKVSYKTKTEMKRVTGTPLERISKRLDGLVNSTGVLVKALKTNN